MSLSAPDFEYVRKLVHERSAIALEASKTYLVESRLGRVAHEHGLASPEALVDLLRRERFGELHLRVVEAMTTNETSFFRDVAPFDVLKSVVIPELAERRAATKRLHFWSAACSSGQEPYSLAIVLREHFPDLASWDVQILATDLSSEMLSRARAGSYSQRDVNRGLPVSLLVKYFTRCGVQYQVAADLRRMVEFRPMNLAEAWPPMPAMDVIFLRNVLIYFDLETKKRILGRIRSVLRPDGYLFLGGAETTINLDDAFERVPCEKTSYYRLRSA
jgi:chemotaxis protein methyltransferase CheR